MDAPLVTARFPRWSRRREPNAFGIDGPVVVPCSRLGRWLRALRLWLRGGAA